MTGATAHAAETRRIAREEIGTYARDRERRYQMTGIAGQIAHAEFCARYGPGALPSPESFANAEASVAELARVFRCEPVDGAGQEQNSLAQGSNRAAEVLGAVRPLIPRLALGFTEQLLHITLQAHRALLRLVGTSDGKGPMSRGEGQ